MENVIRGLLFCLIIWLGHSCSEPRPQLANYYFPYGHNVDYIYMTNDSIGPQIWQIRSEDQSWIVEVYDEKNQLQQRSFEHRVANGVIQDSLFLYDDSGQPIQAIIESGIMYGFEVKDSMDVFFYEAKWRHGDTLYSVVRNRRFLRYESLLFHGKQVSCAVWRLDERIISEVEGQLELSSYGEEWYAQDIGLIRRSRVVNDQLKLEDRLVEIRE